ncbi:hypothetical protein ACTQ46_08060 [Gallicola sp. Sow4_E12]
MDCFNNEKREMAEETSPAFLPFSEALAQIRYFDLIAGQQIVLG